MNVTQAFDGVAEMLAKLDPRAVVQLRADESVSQQVEMLVGKKKRGTISMEETLELERYLALDMLISMAKARAWKILQQ